MSIKIRFTLRAEPSPTDSKATVTHMHSMKFMDDDVIYGFPDEHKSLSHHDQLMALPTAMIAKKDLTPRWAKRSFKITLPENIAKLYVDEEGNAMFLGKILDELIIDVQNELNLLASFNPKMHEWLGKIVHLALGLPAHLQQSIILPESTNLDLHTEDRLEYQFYPVTSNQLTFKIKAPHDAHIMLSSTPYESQPCFEVFFGGWRNTQSIIRKNQRKPDVCVVATPNILDAGDYKGFWIRWDNDIITAGVQGNPKPLLHYRGQLFPIQYFGVCTGWGASGHWIIDHAPSPGFGQLPSQPSV